MRVLVMLFLVGSGLYADPNLENLSRQDLADMMQEFQASFEPSTVSGASKLGTVVGFEVGLVAGASSADRIDEISNGEVSKLPHLNLFARVDVPYGLGLEMTLLPLNTGEFESTNYSFALKWDISEVVPVIPINIKSRLRFSSMDMEYEGNDGLQNYTGEIDNSSVSFDLTFSKRFVMFEPYVGLGYVSSKGDFSAKGSVNVFNFPTQNETVNDIKNSGLHLFAGAHIGLGVFKLGAEYSRLFDQSRVLGKISFGI